ncbi:insulinase family protein [Candidatus Sumerlaeota bacterium]|nr:insulinase family protein [Candidatus Sumerlaeota bacterium]
MNRFTRRPRTGLLARSLLTLLVLNLAATALADGLKDRLVVRKLDNGMTFLVYPRHTAATFAGRILVDVGSSDEHIGITGVAHMFEHMAFKGTETIGTRDYEAEKPLLEEIDRVAVELTELRASGADADPKRIEELQAQYEELTERHRALVKKDEFDEIYTRNGGQDSNASTAYDHTNYFVTLPSNRLDLWMWMESERLLRPVMREFYVERNVILEERNARVENSPQGKLWECFLSQAFVAHPYGDPILGWPDDMRNLTRAKAERFRERFYVPENMIACLVGDVDPEEVFALAERYFGRLPAAATSRVRPPSEPEQIGERRAEVLREANPVLMIGYHKPPLPDRTDEVADVASMILADGRTSRLYKSLVLDKQIATHVSAFTAPGDKYANLFIFYAVPRAPHTIEEVEKAIYDETATLADDGPTTRELERVKNSLDADNSRILRGNAGLARLLAYFTALTGDPYYLDSYMAQLKTVSADEVKDFIRTYLTESNRTVTWIAKADAAGCNPVF